MSAAKKKVTKKKAPSPEKKEVAKAPEEKEPKGMQR